MQTLGYVRVSKEIQTIENQTRLLREKGVTKIFGDEGVSGMRPAMDRSGFKDMIKFIDDNPDPEGCVVWVFELSRVGRNMLDTLNTITDLEKRGIRIYSISDAWTLQPDEHIRKLLVGVVTWIAEQEIISLKKRIHAGLDRARANGKTLGAQPKNVDWNVVDSKRLQGFTFRQIADEMNIHESTLFRKRKKVLSKRLNE
jgi:putative DNA-invertase from lambdoid prophage Rac